MNDDGSTAGTVLLDVVVPAGVCSRYDHEAPSDTGRYAVAHPPASAATRSGETGGCEAEPEPQPPPTSSTNSTATEQDRDIAHDCTGRVGRFPQRRRRRGQ